MDYLQALEKHYTQAKQFNWNSQFIISYASSHPWEDWAETWAHYMHIMDTHETAYTFGLSVHPFLGKNPLLHNTDISIDPYKISNFKEILAI